MELQKIYSESFVAQMIKDIAPEQYQSDEPFDIDNPICDQIGGIYNKAVEIAPLKPGQQADGHKRMIPDKNHDFESAVALFEAYENLSPYFASKRGLWVYLSHNELYSYVKQRWGDTSKIKEHWFDIGRRGSLSGLWWAVYCTYDPTKEGDERYWLTRQLFVNQTFRTRTFFTYRIGMNRDALKGILTFMGQYPDLFKRGAGEARLDYIRKYFGRLGSTKELRAFEDNFFTQELERKMPAIELVKDTSQVRHDRQVWNL